MARTSLSGKIVIVAMIVVVIIAVPLIVLTMNRRNPPADRATTMALNVMRGDLRGLALAEATTKRLRGRFSANAEDAGHMSSVGVSPPVITLSDSGWTAVVTHKTMPELRCAIGVFARNPLDRFAKSGEIVCEP